MSIVRLFRNVITILIMIILFVAIATGAMIFVYAISTDKAIVHIEESLSLYGQGKNQTDNWASNGFSSRLDNFTDSIMLNNAIFRPYDSIIQNAMLNPRAQYDFTEMTTNLVKIVNQENDYNVKNYPRYWHGYLLFMIPGLYFFTVGELKTILMLFQALILTKVIIELYKQDPSLSFLFVICVLFLNPISTVLSFQYSTIYCIMLIATLIVLKAKEYLAQNDNYYLFFIVIGICTAFFDFLTYPLVALGIPLITFLLITQSQAKVWISIKSTFGWWGGYVGMWSGKWFVSTILTGNNIVQDAMNSVSYRIYGDPIKEGITTKLTYITTLKNIMMVFKEPSIIILLFLFFGFLVYLMTKRKIVSMSIKSTVSYILIGCYPLIWFFIMRNHSFVHPWMAFRQLAVSLWALVAIIISSVFPNNNLLQKR